MENNITLKTNDLKCRVEEREPNEKDIQKYVYGFLRKLYFDKRSISLIQYRTVKGQIRKDYNKGYNFIKKYYPNLEEIVNNYKNTTIKEMVVYTKVTLPESIKVATIDINLNKG